LSVYGRSICRSLVVFEQCVTLCPQRVEYLLRLGACHFSCKDYVSARLVLDRCLAAHDDTHCLTFASALNSLARVKEIQYAEELASKWLEGCELHRDRKYLTALHCFKRVVKLQKRCDSQLCVAGLMALSNVGLCYMCIRQSKDAMLFFEVSLFFVNLVD
jgi:tetratricopeptide (TPR) repeat protein